MNTAALVFVFGLPYLVVGLYCGTMAYGLARGNWRLGIVVAVVWPVVVAWVVLDKMRRDLQNSRET